MKKILYVGWIGFKNLGDELMWHVFHDLSQKYLEREKYQVIPSLPGVDLKDISTYDTVVLGGGSLLVPGYVDVTYQAVQQQKQVIVWGSGFDTLESVKLDENGVLLTPPAWENDRMRRMLEEIAFHAAFFGVRGPLTYQYLQQAEVKDRVMVSGDPGMLLLPTASSDKKSENEQSVIGINWGTTYNRIYGKNEEAVENALAEAAKQLIKAGHHIYIFTMWTADREANKRLYKKIAQPAHTTLDLELHDHRELMRRISNFRATINFKLHANVVSAAAGVPFVCLAYRFKCLDFAHSLGIPETIVQTDQPQLERHILSTTQNVLQNTERICEKITNQQKKIIQHLELPFVQHLF